MKFSEMPYTRPDIDALLAQCRQLAAKAAAAPDGDALAALYFEQSEAFAASSLHRASRASMSGRV